MNTYFHVLLIVLGLMNIYLVFKVVAAQKGIRNVTAILRDVRNENFNRRVHMRFNDRSMEELAVELNRLIDKFGSIIEQKQFLEMSHKKLISNISHDIRTPLTSLLGYVEALQQDQETDPYERKKYLNIIESKGQTLYRLIQEFFELSKLESDDVIVKLEKIDLNEKVKEVLTTFYQDLMEEKVIPELYLPEESVYVQGDGTSIERILQNLISNALRYGKDGGTIGIVIREEQDKVWVDVWDRGKGIPAKDMQFVFDRLYTAEPSRNDKLRGSGLGLAIAKRLVEKQNGEITVASTLGEKTVFSFYLYKM